MKVLALDYGSARTGVAVSDPTGAVARPLCVVESAATEVGIGRLLELARAEEAEAIVVGLPVTLRGERGPQARETERFVELGHGSSHRDLRRAFHDEARGGASNWAAASDATPR